MGACMLMFSFQSYFRWRVQTNLCLQALALVPQVWVLSLIVTLPSTFSPLPSALQKLLSQVDQGI